MTYRERKTTDRTNKSSVSIFPRLVLVGCARCRGEPQSSSRQLQVTERNYDHDQQFTK